MSCSVHDAISLETGGIPTATVCTADFLSGGLMQAASMHVPDYALVSVPQDYITRSVTDVRDLAAAAVDAVVLRLIAATPPRR